MQEKTNNRIASFLKQDLGSKKIDPRIVSLFLKELSLLLNSGISLDKGLEIIKDQKLDRKLTKSLSEIVISLNRGNDSYTSFQVEKEAFDPLTLAFIKSADKSGEMGEILNELSLYITEDVKNKNKIKRAFIYPIILLIVTILVVISILIFVMPTFVNVFKDAGRKLPLATRMLLASSEFLKNNGIYILIAIMLVLLLFYLLRKNYKKRLFLDKLVYTHKPFKKFSLLNTEYKISSLFYILRKGDVDIIESIEIIKDAFKNEYAKTFFDNIKNKLVLGVGISEAFKSEGEFSNLFISMLKIGEDSANLEDSLERAADYYKSEYIYRLERISQLVEPILILIMACIVAFVVFSVAIPMFDSVNNINY